MEMLAYSRVSTPAQAVAGHSLATQRAAIQDYAYPRGWQLGWIADAGHSAASLRQPGISAALDMLKTHQADGLIVARLDRLSRSLRDFADLIDRAHRQHWSLVCIEPALDLTTPTGELAANILAAVAQWERQIIVERTREGFAAAKAQGRIFGNPRRTPIEVAQRIHDEVAAGESLHSITRRLNAEHVPTALGYGTWYKSHVQVIARRPVTPPAAPPLPPRQQTALERLTKREHDVIALIQANKSNDRIGQILGINTRTVEWHVHNMKIKLGIRAHRARSELRVVNLAQLSG